MIINRNPEQHLTYCLNVHPGESWDDNFDAIKKYALEVREKVCPYVSFGLGMRLSRVAADELIKPKRLSEFKEFLAKHDLYVFTINGFPYGQFHGMRVKEKVYQPDWTTDERVEYTNLLAEILAELLPDNVMGSISSVPGKWCGMNRCENISDAEGIDLITKNISKCADYFNALENRTGKQIMLALEPEPDCLIDSTDTTIEFFNDVLAKSDSMISLGYDWSRYIGLCFDTCHLSVVFESPLESMQRILKRGIVIAKVQVSAALRAETGAETAEQLSAFAENVYLHQCGMKTADGDYIHNTDLTHEFLSHVAQVKGGEVRVHMHVPLYFENSNKLFSTIDSIPSEFFNLARTNEIPHLEIETYTFDVLPDELSFFPIAKSIQLEFKVLKQFLK